MNQNVAVLFQEQAAKTPDQVALVFPGAGDAWEKWTYRDLNTRSDAYANSFAKRGLNRGDRVLFLVKPSLEFFALLLGLLKLGAIPTVVDPGMGLKNVLKCVEQIKPRAVCAIPLVHAVRFFVRKPFASADLLFVHGTKLFLPGVTTATLLEESGNTPFKIGEFQASDDAFIVFTSGSTGTPKGVAFTHGMFAGATRLMEKQLGFAPGKISIETFAPFVVFHLAAGEQVVVPRMDMSKPITADPAEIIRAIDAFKPETMFASPVVLRKVMNYANEKKLRLDSLKLVLTGVAPIPGDLHRGLVPLLAADGRICVNYGATEALMATFIETSEILGETWDKTAKGYGNCVGHLYPEMEARIIRITDDAIADWSHDLLVPDGDFGEIVVKGPLASPEYKDLPEANAKAKIRDTDGAILHRMGDLGYRDGEGRFWFCGRKAHRLETATGLIPNVPVEGVFNEHPAVLRSAVVGVGPRGQQVPVLCVELRPGQVWNDTLSASILALADGTRWAKVVSRALPHPGFPMDARHNSKIRNEDLTVWAAQQLPALVSTGKAS